MKTTDTDDIFALYQTGFRRYISECTPSGYIALIITLAFDFYAGFVASARRDPENKIAQGYFALSLLSPGERF